MNVISGRIFLFLAIILIILSSLSSEIPSASGGEWLPAGDLPPNSLPRMSEVLASRHTGGSAMAIYNDALYLAWTEPDMLGVFQVYLKKLSSDGRWQFLGKSLNRDRSFPAGFPALVSSDKSLYLAWVEKNLENFSNLYVKEWNGKEWVPLGGTLNTNTNREAKNPVLGVFKGGLYAAWLEAGEKEWNKLYIKHWNGAVWEADGEGFGLDPRHIVLSPVLVFGENEGYLVWAEAGENGVFQIRYAARDRKKWQVYPDPLNKNPASQAFNPALALFKGVPWLAFQERSAGSGFELQIRHWSGGKWENDGYLLRDGGEGKLNPALGTYGNALFLAWEERTRDGIPGILARQLLPATMESQTYLLNLPKNSIGLAPSFLSGEKDLYLSWRENNPGDIFQIHISKYREK